MWYIFIYIFFLKKKKKILKFFVTCTKFYRKLGNNQAEKIRARGNIHTLHSNDDDNDENNTWNGNSTQQMWII